MADTMRWPWEIRCPDCRLLVSIIYMPPPGITLLDASLLYDCPACGRRFTAHYHNSRPAANDTVSDDA